MKKRIIQPVSAILVAAAVALAGCAGTPAPIAGGVSLDAGTPDAAERPQNLLSLDEAMAGAAEMVEARVRGGTEIALHEFVSPLEELSQFLNDELSGRLGAGGALTVLARGESLRGVSAEQQLQIDGVVSDESAAMFGRYLGAKVVISGTFSRYAHFSQFRIRAVDAETAALLAVYSARIDNRDAVLADVTGPLADTPAVAISENALDHLNRGKDLAAEGRDDEAIEELDKALAQNKKLSEVFGYRGYLYQSKGDYDRAIVDYNEAVRLDPKFAVAYHNRGVAYADKGDNDRAIADYSEAIRRDPKYAVAYYNLGIAYRD
jgi:tetratricopeptide (TPR) repeat protein